MLWGVTAYFNPAGYQSRLDNYRSFRKRLNTPLVAVEMSPDGRFELRCDDADIVVQLAGGDVLWQKERLLNVALLHLPKDCDIVAWLDCDILFSDDNWPARARAALDSYCMVQLFDEVCDLSPIMVPTTQRFVPGRRRANTRLPPVAIKSSASIATWVSSWPTIGGRARRAARRDYWKNTDYMTRASSDLGISQSCPPRWENSLTTSRAMR